MVTGSFSYSDNLGEPSIDGSHFALTALAGPAVAQDNGTPAISTWGFNGNLLEECPYAPFIA